MNVKKKYRERFPEDIHIKNSCEIYVKQCYKNYIQHLLLHNSVTKCYHDGDCIPLKSDACKVHGAIFLVSFHIADRFVINLYNLYNLNFLVCQGENYTDFAIAGCCRS
jgi:hypothetical protein